MLLYASSNEINDHVQGCADGGGMYEEEVVKLGSSFSHPQMLRKSSICGTLKSISSTSVSVYIHARHRE